MTVWKRNNGNGIIPSSTNVFSMSLPPKGHLEYIFEKEKEKNGGYYNICLRPFGRGIFNCGKLCVSQNAAQS
jgi:hypothetical protein